MTILAAAAGRGSLSRASRRLARRAVVPFLVAQLVLVATVLWGHPDVLRGAAFFLSRFLTFAALAVGALVVRRALRREWLLILAAVLLWNVVDLATVVHVVQTGQVTGWYQLSPVTVLGFVVMGVAVLGLVHKEGLLRGSAVWLESAVGAIAIVIVWWIVAGHASFLHHDVGPEQVMANLYPLGDLVAIVCSVALLSSRSGNDPSARLLASSFTVGVIADLMFTATIAGTEAPGTGPWLIVLQLLQFVLLGLAALLNHSQVELPQVRTVSGSGVLVLLVALVAPAISLSLTSLLRLDPNDHDVVLVVLVGTVLMAIISAIRIRRIVVEVERQAEALMNVARTDELTRLPNRRAGTQALEDAIVAAEGEGPASLCVAIIDLDHFKRYNDTRGHLQGDRLLATSARRWHAALDGLGTLYRYGGEEFVAVLPALGADDARDAVDRLRPETPDAQTFSAGVAQHRPGDDALALLARADQGLYASKAAGRARTTVVG